MRYTQKYSELKNLPSNKKTWQAESKRKMMQIYTLLTHTVKQSHRTAFLKKEVTRIFKQEGPRKQQVESKHLRKKAVENEAEPNIQKIRIDTGKEQSEIESNDMAIKGKGEKVSQQESGATLLENLGQDRLDKNLPERKKLKGKWNKEYKMLSEIIVAREDYKRMWENLLIEEVIGIIATHKVSNSVTNFLNACSHMEELDKNIKKAERALTNYMISRNINIYYSIETNIHAKNIKDDRRLADLENRLKETIRKYGCSPWRSALNDVCSDAGFVWSVVTTSLAMAACVS